MDRHLVLGKEGEDFACEYLVEKGYRILERNARETWGEIDIVAYSPSKILVFVEVKTMKDLGESGLRPEDQMSSSKLKKFRKAAMLYAGSHEDLVDNKKGWRLDVLALTKSGENFLIHHYENI